jgi:hypothetical protein
MRTIDTIYIDGAFRHTARRRSNGVVQSRDRETDRAAPSTIVEMTMADFQG